MRRKRKGWAESLSVFSFCVPLLTGCPMTFHCYCCVESASQLIVSTLSCTTGSGSVCHSLLFFFVPSQELQDLGRDPPAQCSAGPVGDDCRLPVFVFYLFTIIIGVINFKYYYYNYNYWMSYFCVCILFGSFFAVFHWQATIMGPVSFPSLSYSLTH